MTKSEELFIRSQKYIPGGVNSPVRAFRAVGKTPLFIRSAKGDRIVDADGREYIDYVCSWGPCILGHAREEIVQAVQKACESGLTFGAPTEREEELARLLCESVPDLEKVRLTSSGTEATMSAIRVARGFTGREKMIKFRGNYHGHSDGLLVKAGSGCLTEGVPDSLGVPKGYAENTLVAEYNDLQSAEELFCANHGQIACVIVEPVAANMGVVPPADGFLQGLRKLCDEEGAVLIFDEVITGFRLAFGGAQEFYGVNADMVCLGKIVGGGMPLACFGGKREIMDMVAPVGGVYQAGTLSGNPVAVAAGIAQLSLLKENKEKIYPDLEEKAKKLQTVYRKHGVCCNRAGSLLSPFFGVKEVRSYADAERCDRELFAKYFSLTLERGIYVAPSPFEAMFLSAAHTAEDVEKTCAALDEVLSLLLG